MRVLHVLDHSIPLHSGYTFRTLALLREQRAMGWDTHHLTSPKHGLSLVGDAATALEETIDGWHFHRTPAVAAGNVGRLPGLQAFSRMWTALQVPRPTTCASPIRAFGA